MRHHALCTYLFVMIPVAAAGCDADSDEVPIDAVSDTRADASDATTPPDAAGDATETGAPDTDETHADADATSPDADATPSDPAVVINEVYATGGDDWAELHNPSDAAVDVSGWRFEDDDPSHTYALPAGSIIDAGGYLVIHRGASGFDFGLGGSDEAKIFDGDALVDATAWEDLADGFSWGRFPNGTGDFSIRFEPSPGAANPENVEVECGNGAVEPTELCDGDDVGDATCEGLGFAGGDLACGDDCRGFDTEGCALLDPALVINEVTSQGDDNIEIFNHTEAEIDLSGYTISDDAEHVYVFPVGTTIAAGAYLVLAKGEDHDFGLGSDDWAELRDDLGELVDKADWPEDAALVSYCRIPNGVGGFQSCEAQSFGGPND